MACHVPSYVDKYDVLKGLKPGGSFLLNSVHDVETTCATLPDHMKAYLAKNHINFYIINATKIAAELGLGSRTNTIMQSAFFKDRQCHSVRQGIQRPVRQGVCPALPDRRLGAETLVAGYDHRFGHDRIDCDAVAALGLGIVRVDECNVGGTHVSSTAIRRLIEPGSSPRPNGCWAIRSASPKTKEQNKPIHVITRL